MDARTFFSELAVLIRDNPAYPADERRLWMMNKLGLEPGKGFAVDEIDPAIARGLNWAVKEAQVKIAQGPIDMKGVNGWLNLLNLGRYGTDYNGWLNGLQYARRHRLARPGRPLGRGCGLSDSLSGRRRQPA